MQFFGTTFSLVLGAWRLRFSIALEEDVDDAAAAATSLRNYSGKPNRRISTLHR